MADSPRISSRSKTSSPKHEGRVRSGIRLRKGRLKEVEEGGGEPAIPFERVKRKGA